MALTIVQPKTVRLTLADSDWIEVKELLNHGEYRDLYARSAVMGENGELRRDPLKFIDAICAAYLVDWSLTGLPIRDARPEVIEQQLRHISEQAFQDIKVAIETHAMAIRAAEEEKKRTRSGDSAWQPIS